MSHNEQQTEQEWIARLQQGDEEAYRWLFDQYYDLLCRMACVWLHGDRYAAQTIVGDVVFRIWQQGPRWHIERSLRSYLIRSVRNGCLNLLHSAPYAKKEVLSDTEPNEGKLEPPPMPDGLLIEQEFEQHVAQALNALPQKTREVFILCRIEQLSYAQVAQRLGITPHTVKYHITTAIKLLHEQLKPLLISILLLATGVFKTF